MSLFTSAPSQTDLMTTLVGFLGTIVPSGVEVIQAEESRLPEPSGPRFIVLTPIMRDRLATNVSVYADCAFEGSVDGATLTVESVQFGSIAVGAPLFGPGVAEGTTIAALGSGQGGAGTYTLSAPQAGVGAPLASGVRRAIQKTQITVQADVHSADVASSADIAQTVTTLFRDDFAVSYFQARHAGLSPLFAEGPRQIPFQNAEQQYEVRWVVDLALQADMAIDVPQQFAAAVTINLYPADVVYAA